MLESRRRGGARGIASGRGLKVTTWVRVKHDKDVPKDHVKARRSTGKQLGLTYHALSHVMIACQPEERHQGNCEFPCDGPFFRALKGRRVTGEVVEMTRYACACPHTTELD